MRPTLPVLAALLLAGLSMAPTPASAQDKPLLSAKIRTVLQTDGLDAAQRAFDEAFPAHKDEYNVDAEGFSDLAREYAQAGDVPTAQAISLMMAAIAQDMMAASGLGGAIPNIADMVATAGAAGQQQQEEQQASEQAEWEAAEEARIGNLLGEPRDDLERFIGQYGDPAAQDADPPRNLFAALRCDGYLVVGATWGDASNWHLKSLSDLEFEARAFGDEIISFSFEMGDGGHASVMNTSADILGSRLEHVGPLPEGWGACIPRPVR